MQSWISNFFRSRGCAFCRDSLPHMSAAGFAVTIADRCAEGELRRAALAFSNSANNSTSYFHSPSYFDFGVPASFAAEVFAAGDLAAAGLPFAAPPALVALPSIMVVYSPPSMDASYL